MKLKTLLLAGLFIQIAFAQDFEKVKPQDLRSSVDFLSSDVLKGREIATQGELVAAQFIRSKFIEAGIKPYFNTYFDTFESTRFKGVNVVGFIEGSDPELKDEIVLLGAHYDHIGLGPKVKNDSIANGANDNASGTAAVWHISNTILEKWWSIYKWLKYL